MPPPGVLSQYITMSTSNIKMKSQLVQYQIYVISVWHEKLKANGFEVGVKSPAA